MRVGYLVPEFPGQTHIFFWRELRALRDLGFKLDIVSTRRPKTETICHRWSGEAMQQTSYLVPLRISLALSGLWLAVRSGPSRWVACVRVVLGVEGETLAGRVRLAGLILMGGQLAALARRFGWAHVHVHSCADSAYIAVFAQILGDLPYSLTLHGPLRYFGGGQRHKWRHATFAVAVTHRLRDEVMDLLSELSGERISVAPMGVDFEMFSRRSRYEPAPSNDTARLVTCGRLHHGKGHQDLVRAASILIGWGRKVQLTILGEGPAHSSLKALIGELELKEVVRLAGAVAEDVVRDTLEASHLFVLASHEEAIGVALMEAMAMSLPVVATRVGGIPELVRDGVEGLLVEPRNPQALAEAIERLLGAPDLSEQMGKTGASRVRRYFGSHVSARIIAERLSPEETAQDCSDGNPEVL